MGLNLKIPQKITKIKLLNLSKKLKKINLRFFFIISFKLTIRKDKITNGRVENFKLINKLIKIDKKLKINNLGSFI